MNEQVCYSDAFIEITASRVLFRHYGIFGGNRGVPAADIEKVVARNPDRANRDKIYFAFLKEQTAHYRIHRFGFQKGHG